MNLLEQKLQTIRAERDPNRKNLLNRAELERVVNSPEYRVGQELRQLISEIEGAQKDKSS